jgi:hypothetical protein
MPLLKPELAKLIREADSPANATNSRLGEQLEESGLSLENDLDILAYIASNSTSESLKLKAVELSLKLKGLLKTEQAYQPPVININISDPAKEFITNPILIPREIQEKIQ